jgi:hypothetical protein
MSMEGWLLLFRRWLVFLVVAGRSLITAHMGGLVGLV